MAYHPNLFGKGRPGIFVNGQRRLMAYDLINETWSTLQPANSPNETQYVSTRPGYGQYIPSLDSCIIFCINDSFRYTYLIAAGAGNESDVLTSGHITDLVNPLVQIRGGGDGFNQGHVVEHPNDPNRLLLLEEHRPGGLNPRVWDSGSLTPSGVAANGIVWTERSWSHPGESLPSSNGPEFTCGTGPYGCIFLLSSNGSGAHLHVWKPDD